MGNKKGNSTNTKINLSDLYSRLTDFDDNDVKEIFNTMNNVMLNSSLKCNTV